MSRSAQSPRAPSSRPASCRSGSPRVLLVVAAIIAPSALKNTSWAYVLPYMTILAIAALGQMLVIMQAGIDLSTPGVISLGGNLLVGVSVGSHHGLAVGILACVGLGTLAGLVNGVLVGIVRLNPLIVTLAVGQILPAWNSRYARDHTNSSQVPGSLSSWAAEKPLGHQQRLLDGRRDHARRRARASLHGRRTALSGGGREPASRVDGRPAGPNDVVFAYTAAGTLYGVAAVLLAGIRINVDPAFGAAYLLAPIAAVVIAGASLAGGLASATSTWMAALALTFLTQMFLILGLSAAMQYIVYGAAIIAGMLVSGDRIASLMAGP